VNRGDLFRARYRVKNIIGWTDYSPIGYILAAVPPSQPPQPAIVTASSTLIQIQIFPSVDDGGSSITSYELLRDDGHLGAFSPIASYDGLSSTFDLSLTSDPALTVGLVYRFKVRSINVKGPSEFSPIISAALADLPAQVASPTKILYLSSKTSIALEWALNVDTASQLPGVAVTGYEVQVDDGMNGDFITVFYGKNVPSLHQYIVGDLIQQRGYRFRIRAENFNGFGPYSNIVTFFTCLPPS